MFPNRMTGSWITLPTDALRIYFNLCIIKYFLNIISPNNDMKAKVKRQRRYRNKSKYFMQIGVLFAKKL